MNKELLKTITLSLENKPSANFSSEDVNKAAINAIMTNPFFPLQTPEQTPALSFPFPQSAEYIPNPNLCKYAVRHIIPLLPWSADKAKDAQPVSHLKSSILL